MDKELLSNIRKLALQNAIKFNGKANPGAIIGSLISTDEALKKDLPLISKEISKIVLEINKIPLNLQIAELEKSAPQMLQKKEKVEEKRELKELPNAVFGKVVTRLAPEPSKYNHIGHAMSFLLNYAYSQKYGGKCWLRFEDTNPEKCTKEYVEAMQEDVIEYLNIKPFKIKFVSDDMDILYDYAAKLIDQGHAYMCFCDRDTTQDLRAKGEGCKCREKDTAKNIEEWIKFKKGEYKVGECTLRFKGDMTSMNMVMRDPVLYRMMEQKHFKHGTKYCVWPMFDFYNPIEDHLCGVTHALRSNEFDIRIELQNKICELLSLNKPTYVQYGRFNVIGAVTQGREIRALIESKEYRGWDDPRLMTLRALKRRGIKKEVYFELIKEVGLCPHPSSLDFKMIAAISRKMIDGVVNRYFFIKSPVELTVEDAPKQKIALHLHPEHPERGNRILDTHEHFFIQKEDFEQLSGLCRLMDCINFEKVGNSFIFHSTEYEKFKKTGNKIIHWLPKTTELVPTKIMMEDSKYIEGFAEPAVRNLKVGDLIQFERFGFCKLDKKNDVFEFWFTHK